MNKIEPAVACKSAEALMQDAKNPSISPLGRYFNAWHAADIVMTQLMGREAFSHVQACVIAQVNVEHADLDPVIDAHISKLGMDRKEFRDLMVFLSPAAETPYEITHKEAESLSQKIDQLVKNTKATLVASNSIIRKM